MRNKIAVTFMTIIFCTVLILGNAAYMLLAHDNRNRMSDMMGSSVRQMSKSVDLHINNIRRVSLAIFSDPIIQSRLRNPTTEFGPLHDLKEINYRLFQNTYPWPYIQGAYIFASDGRIFHDSKGQGPQIGYTLQDEPWYPSLSEIEEEVIYFWPTDYETTPFSDKEQVFSLIRPIKYIVSQEHLGYIKIDIHIDMLKDTFLEGAADKKPIRWNTRYLLLDQHHQVMFDTNEQLTGSAMPDSIMQKLQLSGNKLNWNNQDYLYDSYRSTYNKWTVVALTPYAVVVEQSAKIRNMILLIGTVSFLIIGLVSYLMASSIVRPITQMISAIKKVELGDFKVRTVESGARDEFGRLSRLFNVMLNNIDHLIHRVLQTELREKEAKLQALQAQINPHMLFNTLNAIKALSRQRDVHDVAEIAESLASMFRYSMQGWGETVSLREELDHIHNYMYIQEIRFSDRVQYMSLVDECLLDAQIIRLSLQPLVENAMIHGLEKHEEGGLITISANLYPSAKLGEQLLEICVAASVPGMNDQRVKEINQFLHAVTNEDEYIPGGQSGIGLLNIQKRIRLFFGNMYGLRFENDKDGFTKVYLTIPYTVK